MHVSYVYIYRGFRRRSRRRAVHSRRADVSPAEFAGAPRGGTANLLANIVDFRGFDS